MSYVDKDGFEVLNRATAQLAIEEYHKQLDKRIADLNKEMNDIIMRLFGVKINA